ncbi:hypothetical protein QPK32_12615 [Massilia sp. YIM B02763]|uniref:hypothetical protein n=1 Tax=Massilia sp. YIM B02763 TaxID=3050130 RepID=UPI0025B70EC4|nr:hypothetical protein [Massilia sp. YIM B02763]MDN4053922.1 hypothetical protein [Massilia sp. YIM B02763]
MDKPSIPEDIRRFVLTSIPSVPFLEALLLMRADPLRSWHRESLARRLYVREKTADTLLADLCTAGMVARCPPPDTDCFRYAPVPESLRERIDRLADLYSTHLVEVTHLIHSSLDRKAQQFADAFKWRKDS